jgi:hypothetical protein
MQRLDGLEFDFLWNLKIAEGFAAYCGSRHGVAGDHGSSSLVLAIETLRHRWGRDPCRL